MIECSDELLTYIKTKLENNEKVILTGLDGSGKTTIISKFIKKYPEFKSVVDNSDLKKDLDYMLKKSKEERVAYYKSKQLHDRFYLIDNAVYSVFHSNLDLNIYNPNGDMFNISEFDEYVDTKINILFHANLKIQAKYDTDALYSNIPLIYTRYQIILNDILNKYPNISIKKLNNQNEFNQLSI